ncbi:alkaline phosphatase D family protein [Actinopolymorpha sp. B11F2]|uniref:alkaline phosphatase D family protein n=1 Tax=Actinopolymorpha sp. B11F2 TaxID=3160862 RepID=UPI0032E47816
MRRFARRGFLGLAGAAGLGTAWTLSGFSDAKAWGAPAFSGDPFQLGVASGDPEPDGVVLWTRLAPEPLAGDGRGGMPKLTVYVDWEVAEDELFRRVVVRGKEKATPELGHSVHAEVTKLRPGREYFYRFRAGDTVSPVGRTRTPPAGGAMPDELRFAFASCQNYPDGFYTAYQHMAQEDLDVVVHLGDYIYEGSAQGSIGRGHLPAAEIFSLADYRIRHAQHKTDPDLRAAHAAFPWIVTWDDHEVENNYADENSSDPDQSPEEFLQRRALAYQAYYEHLPLRRSSLPHGPDLQLYRRVGYGQLAEFHVLDGRQYRSDQACGDGLVVPCEEAADPARTMLGTEQERWLANGLAASKARWQILANQSVMAEADRDPGPGKLLPMDNWNGYEPARQRLFDTVAERGVENLVVITGDAHASMVTDLKLNFDDPASTTVGAEFLGTSITSGGNGSAMDTRGQEWLAANPNMKYYSGLRGYVRCSVTDDEWRADYRLVPFVRTPGAPVHTDASFVVEAGRPGVQLDTSSVV